MTQLSTILPPTELAAILANHVPEQPPFSCPFPSAWHPDAEAVQAHTTAWAQDYGLLATEADVTRFAKRAYGVLMGQAYPTTSFERLAVIADWNTWLFALDDQCDEAVLGRDLGAMSSIHDRILDILAGAAVTADDPRHLYAFADIVDRMRVLQPAWWFPRSSRRDSADSSICASSMLAACAGWASTDAPWRAVSHARGRH